jgi:hypothetical protein
VRCGAGGDVVSNDHIVHVRDAAGEHGDSNEHHGEATPDERTAAAGERDDRFDPRRRDGDDQPHHHDREDEGEDGCQQEGRDSQRDEGAGALRRVLATGGKSWL